MQSTISEKPMTVAVEVRELCKQYGSASALEGLTLSVPSGQVLGVLGRNSCGKTMLIKMIAGILPPDSGSVLLYGYDLACEPVQALQQVTTVLQAVEQPDGHLPVAECMHSQNDQASEELLRAFGLWKYRGKAVRTLSYGFRRRAALARGFSAARPILLLDDPALGLDAQAAHAVEMWAAKAAHEQGKTVILTTCQPQLAESICDRVVALAGGHLIADVLLERQITLSQKATYRIRVRDGLDARWAKWFEGMQMTTADHETVLYGPVADQPALHGLLVRIRDLGMPLISVQLVEPALEKVLSLLADE
jgi:ABC-2 type transport system ATP-binding protein